MAKETTVFLSSTSEDLREHRGAILEVLAKFKRQVTAMEYFGARPVAPLETCLREVRQSGIYIGVIGTRYGSIARDGKSFTQLEYEEAFLHQKNILIYMIDEERHPVLPKHVDKGAAASCLSDFKELLLSRHTCKAFNSPDNLAGQLGVDLIALFDDIGENVRAALERDFSHILVEAGFLFSSRMDLMVALQPDGTSAGGFRFKDKDFEAVMAAAFLAQALRSSNFSVLSHFVTLRHEVWEPLIFFLKREDLNEEALADEIKNCDDSLRLRLLIKLAGEVKAASCADAICRRLFDSIPHHKIIKEFQVEVTPFNTVVEEALRQMPASTGLVVEKYMALAKQHKKWQAKRVLEGALKNRGQDL